MDAASTPDHNDLLSWTSQIVAAFVGNNAVRATELPELIASVHAAWRTGGRSRV